MKISVVIFFALLPFVSWEAAAKKGEVARMADGTLACVEKGGGAIITGPTGRWTTNAPATVGNECETSSRATNPATQYFEGVRFASRFGYVAVDASGDQGTFEAGSGLSYGFEAGYDVAIGGNIVAGPYVMYEFSSVDPCDGPNCIGEDGNLGVGGRLGIATPSLLFYGKLGYARIRVDSSNPFANLSGSQSGIQGALGLNVALGRRFYGTAEVSYADYGDFFGASLQRRQLITGFGVHF